MPLLAELKRRNVIRMAGLYLVGAWLIVQVSETVLPAFDVPAWVLRAIILVLAIGLLPALVVSWLFELTPEGLKRDGELPADASGAPRTARRMDRLLVAAMALALAYFAFDKFVLQADAPPEVAAAAAPAPAAIADKSIAVLPFDDFSQAGDQAWFADGLTEEILNALARTPDLLVSARTSSFKYKDSDLSIPQIAAELGVVHVLEGSVRSSPGRIRVTAQLIRAADGFHVWSQTYDREAADVIAIQEDLAKQIATAMQTSMDPAALADMADVGTRSVEAYQAYLEGTAKLARGGPENVQQAYAAFERARSLDPTFARAHARAAEYWLAHLSAVIGQIDTVDLPPAEKARRFGERIDLAIEHANNAGNLRNYRAMKALLDLRLREAVELQRAVLADRPADTDALAALVDLGMRISDPVLVAQVLDQVWTLAPERPSMANRYLNYGHRGHDPGLAADRALQILARAPDDLDTLYQVQRTLLWAGRVAAAREIYDRWRRAQGSTVEWLGLPGARQACAEGRRDAVEQMLLADPGDNINRRWTLLTMLGRHDEAAAALMPLEASGNTYALSGFLVYTEFDPTPFPSLMRVLAREGVQRPPPVALPFACPPAASPPR